MFQVVILTVTCGRHDRLKKEFVSSDVHVGGGINTLDHIGVPF